VQQSARVSLAPVGAYCAAHALVDASCAALIFSASAAGRLPSSVAIAAVVTYNLLAFASQPVLGWFVSDTSVARTWAAAGALATAFAFVVGQFAAGIWVAVIVAGLGNAVFHLGGGVIALRAEPGRTTIPGLYVAPGAAGLAAGIWMGTNQWFAWLPALLLVLVIPLFRHVTGSEDRQAPAGSDLRAAATLAVVGLMFVVVAMRAFVGSGIGMPWKADPWLLVGLTAAVVAGKAAGGVLADRFGRVVVGVGALVLSAPLLVIAPGAAQAGIAGMFLFNMTMPVTLVAIADVMPERPGLAFGLTCLALIMGSLPVILHLAGTIAPVPAVLWVLGSAALLWRGLTWAQSGRSALAGLRSRPEEV
jgi:FSR family fosmidomycin resistance protein-like MFS transporter